MRKTSSTRRSYTPTRFRPFTDARLLLNALSIKRKKLWRPGNSDIRIIYIRLSGISRVTKKMMVLNLRSLIFDKPAVRSIIVQDLSSYIPILFCLYTSVCVVGISFHILMVYVGSVTIDDRFMIRSTNAKVK